MSADRNYYDDGFDNGYFPDEDDDAVDRFIDERSRRSDTDTDYDELRKRMDYYVGDSYHHLSRESEAARQVLAEGRVSQNPYARRQTSRPPSAEPSRRVQNTDRNNQNAHYGFRINLPGINERHAAGRNKAVSSERPAVSPVKRLIKTLLLIVVSVVVLYYAIMSAAVSGVNREKVNTRQDIVAAETVRSIPTRSSTMTVKNVLLLGIDDDGGSGSRSDTIMIASVDTLHNKVRLCSILRDNYVTIPGHKNSRINSAYAYGGAELTMMTIEANYRLHLDDYVSVSMDALISVVDAVGGVDITITEAEAKQINRYSLSENKTSAGTQHLDGKQAVCYARIRKIDSDFGRTNRQRTLINAIVARCKQLSPIKLAGVVKEISPYLTTNMSSAEIATLGLKVLPALGNEIEQMSLPLEGAYESKTISGMAVLVPDLERNTRALHEFLYGEK